MAMKTKLILAMSLSLALVSCSDSDDSGKNGVADKIELQPSQELVITSQNSKAIDMLGYFSARRNDNFMLSPMSMNFALGLAANGAAGATLNQICTATGADNLQSLNDLSVKLIKDMPRLDRKVKMEIANSIWLNDGFEALPAYVNAVEENYDADSRTLDLSSTSAMNAINNWCSKHTDKMIPQLLQEPLAPGMEMMIINALCFKGEWAVKFDKKNTKEDLFTNADGSQSRVMMMNGTIGNKVKVAEKYSMFRMDYGAGAYSMTVILPNAGENLTDVISSFSASDFVAWQNSNNRGEIKVSFPRFEFDTNEILNDYLQSQGVSEMFTSGADFSGLSASPVKVNKVKQVTRIEVDEDGTKAAAVTSTEFDSAMPVESYEMVVNRPFAFIITEQSTGAVIFLGQVKQL